MSRVLRPTMPERARPIRIPRHIDITLADPPFAIAGERSTWRLSFRLSRDVPADALLKFQLCGGRNNKGDFPDAQVATPEGEGYIVAEFEDGTRYSLEPDRNAGTYTLSLPEGTGLRKGQELVVILGDRTQGGAGIRVGHERLLNKFFILYSVPNKTDEPEFPSWAGGSVWAPETENLMVAACTMHVLGGAKHHIRAYVPAMTIPGEPFYVLVRPEDEFGNLSCEAVSEVVVSDDGQPLDVRIEEIPDSTCGRVTISLATEGVHRLEVRGKDSGCEAMSNPTICSSQARALCWGMIHGHTEMSDGTGRLEQYFHQLKNEVGLDFAAPGDHDHLWETPDEFWEVTCEAVKHWHEQGTFLTFLGYEWAKWRQNGDGDRNVYYLHDDRPLYRSDEGEYPSPSDLFGALTQNEEKAIVIPHHPGHGGNFCDWKDHDSACERLVEIFQMRGSYECSEAEGNPVPERKSAVPPYEGGYVQNALALGWRVGFTAGGDDHHGHWGSEFCFSTGYKQGLMGVEAEERSREAIFAAMYERRVVATTGARILLTYSLNGHPMGTELSLRTLPELAHCRRLAIEFHGTAGVDRVDIIRNNMVLHSASATGEMDLSITWEDQDPMDDIWLPAAKFCDHPFAFYYIRVVQEDGEVAWASPVWIDP